jgi:hypothetical protein
MSNDDTAFISLARMSEQPGITKARISPNPIRPILPHLQEDSPTSTAAGKQFEK